MNDVASYVLGVQIHEDQDGDGHIAWYDCDDNNSEIYPNAIEVALDGIDQNCDGEDHISPTSVDPTEALGVQYLAPSRTNKHIQKTLCMPKAPSTHCTVLQI